MLNLNEKKFRFAISIEDYHGIKKLKNDPEYVKWLFREYGKRNGKWYQRIIPHHKCTDEDFEEFYPVQEASRGPMNTIRGDPERGFLCPEWNDDEPLNLIGDENDDDYTRLEVVLLPCNYVHTMLGT